MSSSARVDDYHGAVDMDVNGDSMSASREIPVHEQESNSESAHEPRHSSKRTKISASGSWREGDIRTGNSQQDAMDWTTSFCSGTMDGSLSSPDHNKHQDIPPYASLLSGTKTRATSSTPTSTSSTTSSPSSKSQRKTKTKIKTKTKTSSLNEEQTDDNTPFFTIYEDPEDHDLQEFTLDLGMGYGLEFGLTYRYEHDLSPGIPIPESWHSCPGDDKENADEAVHEHGTEVDYEADGVEHGLSNGNGSDDDEDASTIIVEDVRGDNERPRPRPRHGNDHGYDQRELGGIRRYYQHSAENGTVVVPSRERSQGHDGQISPTLLGAPPRRFQGRGSRQA